MLTNKLSYTAVICLTFSSMVQTSAISAVTVVDEMREELKNCSFPPTEVLWNREGTLITLCGVTKPVIRDGKPDGDDLQFFFAKYLCMELFDLSLQLCGNNRSGEKIPTTESEFNDLLYHQNVENFCEKLNLTNVHAKKTSQWAEIARATLTSSVSCESQCIKQNTLNPLCAVISWASNLLITLEQKKETPTKSPIASLQGVPASGFSPSQKHDTGEVAVEGNDADLLPKKDIASQKTLNSSAPVESKRTESKASGGDKVQSVTGEENAKSVANVLATDKHSTIASTSSFLPTTVSTVSSVVAEIADKEMEKEEDRDDDSGTHASRMSSVNNVGNDDITITSDVDGINLGQRGSVIATFPQEGAADEDKNTRGNIYQDGFVDAQDSHFFAYFLTMVVICIVGYLVFHNKQKIIALALEGRRMQGSRRRPNTSSYKKLDSNLEEAVTSTCSSSSVTHVIF